MDKGECTSPPLSNAHLGDNFLRSAHPGRGKKTARSAHSQQVKKKTVQCCARKCGPPGGGRGKEGGSFLEQLAGHQPTAVPNDPLGTF